MIGLHLLYAVLQTPGRAAEVPGAPLSSRSSVLSRSSPRSPASVRSTTSSASRLEIERLRAENAELERKVSVR